MTQALTSRWLVPLLLSAALMGCATAGPVPISYVPTCLTPNRHASYRVDVDLVENQPEGAPSWMLDMGRPREASGHGSGTIIHEDGLILTSAHVVTEEGWKGTVTVVVSVRGEPQAKVLQGTIVAIDHDLDLAVIQIDQRFPHAGMLGERGELQDGEAVYNVGYPFDFGEMIGRGHVMRQDYSPPQFGRPFQKTMLLDISDGSGTSGSAIFAERTGKIVGVMMAYTFRSDGPGKPPMVVRVAVPLDTILDFLDENDIPYHRSAPGEPACAEP